MSKIKLLFVILVTSSLCAIGFFFLPNWESQSNSSQTQDNRQGEHESLPGGTADADPLPSVQPARIKEPDSDSAEEFPESSTEWWLDEDFLAEFANEFEAFAGNMTASDAQGWREMDAITMGHLEDTLLMPGLLLEETRLVVEDFEELKSDERAGAVEILSQIATNRMELGVDPFGERNHQGRTELANEVLAEGIYYSPNAILRAVSHELGVEEATAEQIASFAAVRKEFLIEASRLAAKKAYRDNAVLAFLFAKRPDSVAEHGMASKERLNLDPVSAQIRREQEDMYLRFREAAQRAILNRE